MKKNLCALGLGICFAGLLAGSGCSTLPPQANPPGKIQTAQEWSGPAEFSADYLWEARRPPAAYDRPVKLVRLVVRQGKAVRGVGIDVFGATIFDELVTGLPEGGTQTRFRQGAENLDGLLLERIVRLVFFQAPQAGRVRIVQNEPGPQNALAAHMVLQVETDQVELKLAGGTVGPQKDSDLEYPPLP